MKMTCTTNQSSYHVTMGLLFLFVSLSLIHSIQTVKAGEVLKACGHHDYAPWNWKSGNNIIGACAEVTKTLFEKASNGKVKVDLTYMVPWVRCQNRIRRGDIDINICSFINDKRKEYSKFIMTPMGFNENAVFVKKGKEFKFDNWQDLKDKRIGMVYGVSMGQEFDTFIKQYAYLDKAQSYKSNFKKLIAGRVDMVPVGRYSGYTIRDKLGFQNDIVDLQKPIITGKLYISMSKKSKYLHLLPKVEKIMQEPGYNDWVEGLLDKYVTIYVGDYTNK